MHKYKTLTHMLFFIVLNFFSCYSKDSMKKTLVTQEMAPIIINTHINPIYNLNVNKET